MERHHPGRALLIGAIGIDLKGAASAVTNSGQIGGANAAGVYLENGGSVTNRAGGNIGGHSNGVFVSNAVGTVTNVGTISGTGPQSNGVYLKSGGSVTNLAGGSIQGVTRGIFTYGVTTVTNAGTIASGKIGTSAYGVMLADLNNRGTIINQVGGSIYGHNAGTWIGAGASQLTNAGTITSGLAGAYFFGPGTATNMAGGKISGGVYGIHFQDGGMVTNAGTIIGGGGTTLNSQGVFLAQGGSLTNLVGGTIVGGKLGVNVAGPGTVVNAGTIIGTHGYGVLQGSGTLVNQAGGTITGGLDGVGFFNASSVTNAGTITGGTGASVLFAGTGTNTLTLQTGSVLNGDAVGSTSAGATNALILQGNGSANNNFLNFNTLDVQASGLWALNGVSAIGATTVDSGTLVVGDATHPGAQLTSPVTVNSGGALAGSGTVIGNVTVASGGTIAPGAATPFTTLQVTGNAAFSPGSFFNVNINPAGQSDKLAVNGTATLTGGTVQVVTQPGLQFTPGTQYTILTATSLGNTTFAGVTSNFAFLTPSLSTSGGDVFLAIARNATSFNAVAQTANQNSVAAALGAASPTSPLALSVLSQTVTGAQQAFDALSGEIYGSLQNTMADESQFMRNAMLGRLRQASYADAPGELGALGFAGPELAYAKAAADDGFPLKAPGKPATASRDYTFWTQGLGGWGHVDGDGNAAALNDRFGGFISGVDALFGTVRAGFAAGYVHSDLNVDARASSAGIDSGQLGLYAGSNAGPLNIRTGASYTFDTIDTSRTIAFPGLFDMAQANLTGNVGQVFGEAGYGFTVNHIAAEPFVGLAYVNVHTGAFAENGGIAALSGSSNDENIGYSSLGLRTATIVPLANGTLLVPRLSAQWQYAFGNVTPQAALAFQSTGAAFSVTGVPIARNAALVDTGLDWRINPKMKISLSYQGELADHAQTHTVKGGFTWNF